MEELVPLLSPGFEEINILRFIINLFLLFLVVRFLSNHFRKNYKQLDGINHNNFNWTNFAIAIYIIVCAIQNSLALSLGMIGALSVIRFRTAIKDPSELIFLLFITGISISFAANMEIIALIITLFWWPVSYYDSWKENKKSLEKSNSLRIEVLDIKLLSKRKLIDELLLIHEKNPRLISHDVNNNLTLFYENVDQDSLKEIESVLSKLGNKFSINFTN